MTTELVERTKVFSDKLAEKGNLQALKSVLPSGMDVSRFCRIAINSLMKNPKLAECDPNSFVIAVINCAEMGLEVTMGQAALVPYKGRVQAQPMYQGLIKLAYNAGDLDDIYAYAVRADDEFEYELGLNPNLTHKPKKNKEGELQYVYAVAVLKNGQRHFEVMNKKEVETIMKGSPGASYSDSPWKKWPDRMWKKTVIKQITKYLKKSAHMERAIMLDNQLESGKTQAPAVADLSEATIDINEMSDERPAGMQKPQEKPSITVKEETPAIDFQPNTNWPMPKGELLSKTTKDEILAAFKPYKISKDDLEDISGIPFDAWTANTMQRGRTDIGKLRNGIMIKSELIEDAQGTETKKPITDKQRKLLFAKAGEAKISHEALQEICKDVWGEPHVHLLPQSKMEEVMDVLEAGSKQ